MGAVWDLPRASPTLARTLLVINTTLVDSILTLYLWDEESTRFTTDAVYPVVSPYIDWGNVFFGQNSKTVKRIPIFLANLVWS